MAQENDGSSHGLWLPWLEASVPVPGRTLRRYMRFYKLATVANLQDPDPEVAEAVWRTVCHGQPDAEPDDDPPAAGTAGTGRRWRWDDPDNPDHGHDLPGDYKRAGKRKPPTPQQRARQRQRSREVWRGVRNAETTAGLAQRVELRHDALRRLIADGHEAGLAVVGAAERHKRRVPAEVWAAAKAFEGWVERALEEVEELAGFGESLTELQAECDAHVKEITPWVPEEGWKAWHARRKARAAGNGDAAR